jgi:uncharacterized protein DUF998
MTDVSTLRRRCAIGAAALAALALLGLAVADLGTPGLRLGGYLSELGAPGAPWQGMYRFAVLGYALALALLTAGVRPVHGLAALALGVAAPLAGVSAAVRCTHGCPLPPTEPTTVRDLVHAGSSTLAVVLAACAMLVLAWRAADPVVRRICGWTAVLMFGLGVPVGVVILAAGRSMVTGVLERALVLVATIGLVGLAAALARPRNPPAGPIRTVA